MPVNSLDLRVDSSDLARFYRNLAKNQNGKEVARELRANLRKTIRPIVSDVQREALSLPGRSYSADELRYAKKMGGAGLGLRQGLAAATEANTRALPNGMFIRIRVSGTKFAKLTGKYRKLPRYVEGYARREWRHPVFADKGAKNGTWQGAWVSQSPMPFLIETVLQHKEQARRAVLKSFDRAVVRMGFR